MKSVLRIGFLCGVLGVMLCEPALAAPAGLPYEAWLEKLTNSITGPVAGAMILIGIVGAGAMLVWGGEISTFLKTIVYLTLVAAFLVGSTKIYMEFFGKTEGYALTEADRAVVSVLEPRE